MHEQGSTASPFLRFTAIVCAHCVCPIHEAAWNLRSLILPCKACAPASSPLARPATASNAICRWFERSRLLQQTPGSPKCTPKRATCATDAVSGHERRKQRQSRRFVPALFPSLLPPVTSPAIACQCAFSCMFWFCFAGLGDLNCSGGACF